MCCLSAASQVVKYFLDAKTFQKVKFVYPKNKDSMEVMSSYFDEENLPTDYIRIPEVLFLYKL